LCLDRDGCLWLVYLCITDDQYLEVFLDGLGGDVPGVDVVGYNHMCFAVLSIEQAVRELEAVEIPFFWPKVQGVDGNWQIWIVDLDGHRIELMEMAVDGMQAQAIVCFREN